MIYIIQALSILFAISLAKHDAPAILKFEESGASNLSMAKFHRYNNWTKFFFVVACGYILKDFASVFLSALWIYLVFDPALNLSVKKSWGYIGSNDADGRRWIKLFGERAGELKATILFVVILVTNLLNELL